MNIEVSNNFKKVTTKAIISIALFLIVYILLLALAIALTILSVIGGFYIIAAKPMVITIGLGVGLASLGFFILAFLFKFIFKKHKMDRSQLTEITEQTEPKLFKFINDIVEEVHTDFPKKIYVSTEVNASVFYDSSFWSMFFPIKKNLQIGLGLVNAITEQEFKAILAHEFGHFSQKSMKVGSYVYNVNPPDGASVTLVNTNKSNNIQNCNWHERDARASSRSQLVSITTQLKLIAADARHERDVRDSSEYKKDSLGTER